MEEVLLCYEGRSAFEGMTCAAWALHSSCDSGLGIARMAYSGLVSPSGINGQGLTVHLV